MGYKIVFTLLFITAILLLNAISVDDLYLSVRNAYETIESFQAKLEQTNTFKADNIEIESKADFFYQKDKIRINYLEPQEQSILMDGLFVRFYDKTSKTCVEMKDNDSSIKLNPIYVIDKYWKYSDKKINEKRKEYILTLRPLQENEFKNIIVYINKKSYFITGMRYEDPDENTVEIKFNSVVKNKDIPENVWRMELPEDVHYIKR